MRNIKVIITTAILSLSAANTNAQSYFGYEIGAQLKSVTLDLNTDKTGYRMSKVVANGGEDILFEVITQNSKNIQDLGKRGYLIMLFDHNKSLIKISATTQKSENPTQERHL